MCIIHPAVEVLKLLLENYFSGKGRRTLSEAFDFPQNVFTELSEFSDNNIIILNRIAVFKPAISCVRNQHSTSVPQGNR